MDQEAKETDSSGLTLLPLILPVGELCLQGHMHLSGASEAPGPVFGSQQVGGGGDLERCWKS